MGGRGASSGGRSGRAPKGYRTVGRMGGIKVIRNRLTGKGLPRESSTANANYMGTDSAGKVNQLRLYDNKRKVKKDIDWTHSFEGKPSGTVHSHTWKNGVRSQEHKPLTPSEIKKYKPIIEKATGKDDLKWEW